MTTSENEPIRLDIPFSELQARQLRVGQFVLLNGLILTARDAVHRHLAAGHAAPCRFAGAVVYHCGPVMIRRGTEWTAQAAGPTTSIREEPYMPALIARFGLRGIIGKGGMGQNTLDSCREHGCVYFHAVGGVAQVLASRIQRVAGVHWRARFGSPEAIWKLLVEDFPVLVTMDSSGQSLHRDVLEQSRHQLARFCSSPSLTPSPCGTADSA